MRVAVTSSHVMGLIPHWGMQVTARPPLFFFKMQKQCFKCKQVKSLEDFYKHPQMAGGHLNKCKDCTKKDVQQRIDSLKDNAEWITQERKRCRVKAINCKYKPSAGGKGMAIKNYFEKYPEKKRAKNASQHIKAPKGMQTHHWSYNDADFKDVIILLVKDHALLHRAMIYDQTFKIYRRIDTGELLNSKESHLSLLAEVKALYETGQSLLVRYILRAGKIQELSIPPKNK